MNKAWVYLSSTTTTFVCLCVNVISGIIAARLLGPEGRGELVVIQYYPSLMGSIFCFAIPQALTYFLIRKTEEQSLVITAGTHLSLLLGIIGALLFAFSAHIGLPDNRSAELERAVIIACLAAPAMVITPHLDAINWGLKRFGWCNALRIAGSLGYAIGLILLWMSGFLTALSAALASLLIQTALFLAHMIRLGFRHVLRFATLKTYGHCVFQGVKFFIPVLSILVYGLADRFILINTTTIAQMGYYAVAFAIAYPVSLGVEAFAQVLFVEIADATTADLSSSLAAQRFRMAQVIVFTSIVLLMPLAPFIITLAFGSKYAPAVPATLVLIGAMGLTGLSRMVDFALRARNVTAANTMSSLFALVLLVGLSLWWVPGRGVLGFALALLVAEILRVVLLVIAFKRAFSLSFGDLHGLKPESLRDISYGAITLALGMQAKHNDHPNALLNRLFRRFVPKSLKSYLHWKLQIFRISSFSKKDLERTFTDICSQINVDAIRSLWKDVRIEHYRNPENAAKYADYEYWLRLNIIRAVKLDLHRKRNLRMLDLGSGPGYFLRVARYFGHDVIGVDLPAHLLSDVERKVFAEVSGALFCDVKEATITAYKPLAIQGMFDLITGFLVCFNNHKQHDEWSVAEWEFFVNDAVSHLSDGGQIALDLNENMHRYNDLRWYDKQTLDFFTSVGRVNRNSVIIQK
jgi:O-antigen/teichoic acid export membrane protein/SAM-dependent methyltransferase